MFVYALIAGEGSDYPVRTRSETCVEGEAWIVRRYNRACTARKIRRLRNLASNFVSKVDFDGNRLRTCSAYQNLRGR